MDSRGGRGQIENEMRMLYRKHARVNITSEQANILRLLLEHDAFSYEATSRIVEAADKKMNGEIFTKLKEKAYGLFYEHLSIPLISVVDDRLSTEMKTHWTQKLDSPETFFTMYPELERYKTIMIRYKKQYACLFQQEPDEPCSHLLFRQYHKDREFISSYSAACRRHFSSLDDASLESSTRKISYTENGVRLPADYLAMLFSDHDSLMKSDCYGAPTEDGCGGTKRHDKHDKHNGNVYNKGPYLKYLDSIQLNEIQEACLEQIECNDDNLFLCSPTSTGKTLVAILGSIKLLEKKEQCDNGKARIFIVSPIKALVRQLIGEIDQIVNGRAPDSRRALFRIVGVYSDSKIAMRGIENADICVGTPEKLDILQRRGFLFGLIVLDEMHMLNGERGDIIEAIVARTSCRIIGLSAIMPFHEDIKAFLRIPEHNFFFFDDSYRKTPIRFEMNTLESVRQNDRIPICRALEETAPILFFVNERHRTMEIAGEVVRAVVKRRNTQKLVVAADTSAAGDGSATHKAAPRSIIDKITDHDLLSILAHRIGVHHAGLPKDQRSAIEELFRTGHIDILISTATLAWGINMPCNTVIVYGKFTQAEIIQMCGRAGRSQNTNTHVLGCYYGSKNSPFDSIESNLLRRICFHLNSEICSGTVDSIREAIQWLRRTFLFRRLSRRIDHLKCETARRTISTDSMNSEKSATLCKYRQGPLSTDETVVNIVFIAIRTLSELNMIENFTPTILGRISHQYYVDIEHLVYFTQLNPFYNEAAVLELLGDMVAPILKKIPEDMPLPWPSNSLTSANIQLVLGRYHLGADESTFLQNVLRILSGLRVYAMEKRYACQVKILNLLNMLEMRYQELDDEEKPSQTCNIRRKIKTHFCRVESTENIFLSGMERESFDDLTVRVALVRWNCLIRGKIELLSDTCLRDRPLYVSITDSLDIRLLFYREFSSSSIVEFYLNEDAGVPDRFLNCTVTASGITNRLLRTVAISECKYFGSEYLATYPTAHTSTYDLADWTVSLAGHFAAAGPALEMTYELLSEALHSEYTLEPGCMHTSYGSGFLNITHLYSRSGLESDAEIFCGGDRLPFIYAILKSVAARQSFIRLKLRDTELLATNDTAKRLLHHCYQSGFHFVFENACGTNGPDDCKSVETVGNWKGESDLFNGRPCADTSAFDGIIVHGYSWAQFSGSPSAATDDLMFNMSKIQDIEDGIQLILVEGRIEELPCFRRLRSLSQSHCHDKLARNIVFDKYSENCDAIESALDFSGLPTRQYSAVHIISSSATLEHVVPMSRHASTLFIYLDCFTATSLTAQIRVDDNWRKTTVTGQRSTYLDENGGVVDNRHFISCLLNGSAVFDDFLVSARAEQQQFRHILLKYTLSGWELEFLATRLKDGIGVKTLFRVLFSLYEMRGAGLPVAEDAFLEAILDQASVMLSSKELDGNSPPNNKYIDGTQKLIANKLGTLGNSKVQKDEIANVLQFLRKFTMCTAEISAVQKRFKTVMTAIYSIQKLFISNKPLYTADCTSYQKDGVAAAESKELPKPANLNEYLNQRARCPPPSSSATDQCSSIRITLTIMEKIPEGLAFFFIDESFNFSLFHIFDCGEYFIDWAGPVYAACDHGSQVDYFH